MKKLATLLLLITGLSFGTGHLRAEDKGETPEARKLKQRSSVPKDGDIDSGATLESLLTKKAATDWSTAKGATIEGKLVQVEKEQDGDVHLTIAPPGGETDTSKWLVAEVTPAWQKKNASFSAPRLRKLIGKTVRVSGWLYYEMDDEQQDPRGTLWEIHPVTNVAVK
jgi:hypothetical protein